MVNEKKDPGVIGLQIDAPSRTSSPLPSSTDVDLSINEANLPKPLTLEEKKFLLAVERGDFPNVRRMLQRAHRKHNIDVNCVDSLGRGALTIAIEAENLEMVELLVIMSVETKDALLQAINSEFVEAVELLLEHEELIHKEGELYSWQKVETNTSTFTPDITPLILAAHRNNYEILKILLDRGATTPMPHDVRCGCDECIRQSTEDSLRHSLSRVNEYRALASPSLISLSSTDPLLTAFQLSWELRNLAFAEQEYKSEYLDLRKQCQQFAVDLLDQSRSSQELAIILNHNPDEPPYADGDHMKLARLELAINYKQKKFVAHPNIQQLLAALWYEGVPGFRRKGAMEKLMIIIKVALFFPLYCVVYMIAPTCGMAVYMRKPFMKFLIHASSYLFFLLILILVSQRAEVQFVLLFGTESMKQNLEEQLRRQRGNGPTPLELVVVLYVFGFIWEETQEIWREGIRSYLRNMWNFIDFSRNSLYCLVALLRGVAYIQQTSEISRDPSTAYIAREHWEDFDPQLIAEGLFAGANIFSALKLIHLFSINPHLGPLQISLGRMVIDIVKFFFIYSLVLFAFACGLNQLLWYFADLEKLKCYHKPSGVADWENMGDACMKWRRFGNLFESSQSLFWASFGMIGLENFELEGIKSYTRFWGLFMFGSYSVINVIVLLNLLIAMMSNSYAMIDEHSDTEWKFARTKLWMSYFEQGATLPPPFNILPSVKWMTRFCKKQPKGEIKRGSAIRRKEDRENRYTNVIRSLVWRYVSAMHRRFDDSEVTEDDINEVKSDISSLRYELLEIFERNGMDISGSEKKEKAHLAKRMKVWERRLMKDFRVAPMVNEETEDFGNEKGIARFRRVAKQVVSQTTSRRWDDVVRSVADTQIGRCHNRESFRNQQNLQRAMDEAKRLVSRSPAMSRTCTPVEFYDPTSNTLLELLKNITEEAGEISSHSTIRTTGSDKNSPLTQQLHDIFANKSPSPLPPDLMEMVESQIKNNECQSISSILSQNSNEDVKQKRARSRSPSIAPPPACDIIASVMPAIATVYSSSPNQSSPDPKSIIIETAKVPSPTSKAISSDQVTRSIVSPVTEIIKPCIQSPPLIQITQTDSFKLSDQRKSKESEQSIVDLKIPPKVVKRRAPAPTPSDNTETDISISRPVALKIDPKQGMIPPPPLREKKESTSSETSFTITASVSSIAFVQPNSRPTSPVKTPASVSNSILAPTLVVPTTSSPIVKSISPTPQQLSAASSSEMCTLKSVSSESSENLVQSKEPSSKANKAASSPPTLHPQRKVAEVKTIKRQPKSGWL